jgi:thiamine transport system substrate-binding protein
MAWHWLGLWMLVAGAFSPSSEAAPLRVLTYDSFASPSGLGPVLAREAKRKLGLELRFQTFESETALATRVATSGKCPGDLIVGIDELQFGRVVGSGFVPQPDRLADVAESLWFDRERRFVPFDYGYVAVVYDTARTKPFDAPVSLRALATDERFRKRIAHLDPRTSGTGLAFLAWTAAVVSDEDLSGFWKGVASSAATIAPSWSAAYSLFARGEVDYVLSYSTSPAYHAIEEKKPTVRAVLVAEGHWRQTEAAAVPRCSPRAGDAARVLALLVGPEVQTALPTKQWMYPARANVPLPDAFSALPRPAAVAVRSVENLHADVEKLLRRWRGALER